ncbi:MAG: pyridoxamine 5'-phosphate oxidase family protein [Pleurocapsa minor GSE-CHR-MK-17-07R]|nr:pyridoxamine 5'-phosphate oxidase family protein [Pleurocapsa minor GSE-CHR-MK 17-07R]
MTEIPPASRPIMPKDYGVPAALEGTLPWSWVDERLRKAQVYWLTTLHPAGRPHTMPIWMAWVDNTLLFGTDKTTRKAKNLALNPYVTVAVQAGTMEGGLAEAIIIEGKVTTTSDADLLRRMDDQYEEKYGQRDGWTEASQVIASKIFALAKFPESPTRWVFDR